MTTKADPTDPETGAEDEIALKNGAAAHDNDDHDEGEELSVEDLAIEAGWTPKEKWKGDPGKWVSAAEHLRRTARSAKTLKTKLTERETELQGKEKELDTRIERLERTMTASQKRELAQQAEYFEAKLQEAIESKDPRAIREAMKDKEEAVAELERGEKRPMSDEQFVETWTPVHAPLQKAFWQEHAWVIEEDDDNEVFGDVEELIQRSVDEATEGKRRPTQKEMADALDVAERWLKRRHKDRYMSKDRDEEPEEKTPKAKPTASKRIPVLAGASRGSSGGLASKLPPEALKEADACIKKGLYADREEWAKIYYDNGGE